RPQQPQNLSRATTAGADAETLREQIVDVLTPLGVRLSLAKTRIVRISEGLDFPRLPHSEDTRDRTGKCYVYTSIASRPSGSERTDKTRRCGNRCTGLVLQVAWAGCGSVTRRTRVGRPPTPERGRVAGVPTSERTGHCYAADDPEGHRWYFSKPL